MKRLARLVSALSLGLAVMTSGALAHVGHGDEFQATGGIDRVAVNTETDNLMGIQVNPIEPAVDGSSAVLIPATALVDDNGRQLVFVRYQDFYEPVDVATGLTRGELIEITGGLSVGEQLVTRGSLNLYAESRKTRAAGAVAPAAAASTPATPDDAHAQAHAQGTPHHHDEGFSWTFMVGAMALLAAVVVAATTGMLPLSKSARRKRRPGF